MGKAQKQAKVIVIANRKGGVGKTQTAVNLGVGLARQGKRVLCIDADSQHSLTVSLGVSEPDKLTDTLATVLSHIINEQIFAPTTGILQHSEGVDLLPANNILAGLEISLAGLIGRETILRQYVDIVKPLYDYIIIDAAPTLDLLTINALAASDAIIIPVCPKFLDAKGLELLLKSVAQIKRQINPALGICGILFTMVDRRANLTREVVSSVENAYGSKIRIFTENVPRSVRAAEISGKGISIFKHDPNGKVASAYDALTREVMSYVA
jgi:chromosome partitioning protein